MNSRKHSSVLPGRPFPGERSPVKSPGVSRQPAPSGLSLRSIASEVSLGIKTIFHDHWIIILIATIAFWVVTAQVKEYVNSSTVYKDYITKSCVKVEHADGSAGSCKKLPKSYVVVWM